MRVEVGYTAQFSDGFSGQVRDLMRPAFRQRNWRRPRAECQRHTTRLLKDRNVQLTDVRASRPLTLATADSLCAVIVVIFIALFIISRSSNRTERNCTAMGTQQLEQLVEQDGSVRRFGGGGFGGGGSGGFRWRIRGWRRPARPVAADPVGELRG